MRNRSDHWLSLGIICFVYLILNILFNFVIWQQIFTPERNDVLTIQGESFIHEYFAEVIRGNILNGKNPFTPAANIFYPFGWDFALDDVTVINGLFFLFLRPFFSLHQSLMLIVVTYVFLSNIAMYGLLRLLKISKKTAFLMGLVFGFTPFMAVRVGAHPSYTAIYLFPLLLTLFFLTIRSPRPIIKIFMAILLGITQAITFLTNFYYTVMIFLLVVCFLGYFIAARRERFFSFLKKEITYILLSTTTSMICLVPWFVKAYEFLRISNYAKPISWFDTIAHAADLIGIFVPNRLNPFYQPILKTLAGRAPGLINTFENFIYPGLIILISYAAFIFWQKKLPASLKTKIAPFFYVSIAFWILTLGPFLHILGKKTDILLPYALINVTPFLQMARAPGRFIVIFVFLASIAAAYLIDYLLEKKYARKKRLFFLILLALFFFDQSYTITLPPTIYINLPIKTYQYLKKQKQGTPILEVPFDIRDGLKNLGHFYTPWLPWTQLIHQQPSFGLFGGRIEDNVFLYYKNNALFGPLAKLIDRDTTDHAQVASAFNVKKMKISLDFFGVEYALIKNNEKYSKFVHPLMSQLDFKKVKTDNNYDLWYRKINPKDAPDFQFNTDNDDLFLAGGWGEKEKTGRWVVGKQAIILINEQANNLLSYQTLRFRTKTLAQPQSFKIYVNRYFVKKITLTNKLKDYNVYLYPYLKKGFNIIIFKFAKTHQPSKLNPNNSDTRPLAAFFSAISFPTKKN